MKTYRLQRFATRKSIHPDAPVIAAPANVWITKTTVSNEQIKYIHKYSQKRGKNICQKYQKRVAFMKKVKRQTEMRILSGVHGKNL